MNILTHTLYTVYYIIRNIHTHTYIHTHTLLDYENLVFSEIHRSTRISHAFFTHILYTVYYIIRNILTNALQLYIHTHTQLYYEDLVFVEVGGGGGAT